MSLERLAEFAYELRHGPNCPMPYLIVTPGAAGIIERNNPKNVYSYGKTLDEAVNNAIRSIGAERLQRRRLMEERLVQAERDRARRWRLWDAEHHKHLIWA